MQQFMLDIHLELLDGRHVAVGRNDQVRRKRVFRSADGPDMNVMKVDHPAHFSDDLPDLTGLDAIRNSVQGEPQAVLQQLPGAEQNDDGDDQAQYRIDPEQVRVQDNDPSQYQPGGYDRIRQEVQEGAPDIEIIILIPQEEKGRDGIDQDPDGGYYRNGLSRQGLGA